MNAHCCTAYGLRSNCWLSYVLFFLSDNTLYFWKYPEDEGKRAPSEQISLHNVVTETPVTLAPREICSRYENWKQKTLYRYMSVPIRIFVLLSGSTHSCWSPRGPLSQVTKTRSTLLRLTRSEGWPVCVTFWVRIRGTSASTGVVCWHARWKTWGRGTRPATGHGLRAQHQTRQLQRLRVWTRPTPTPSAPPLQLTSGESIRAFFGH